MIAEKIGDQQFFELLKEVYYDITEPIIQSFREIHQYVGDEVVITWPLASGLKDNNRISCFFRVETKIKERKTEYLKKLGTVPSFKAGLHLGKVTVGEIGVIKRKLFTLVMY